ncbi:signal peptidase I [Patescibacteria group bacterium]
METKKFLKSLIGWILYIAILAGLIYGIPRGLTYVLKTEYPMASITSGSMWPTLKKGDMVFIKGINNRNEVDTGDIIVYKNLRGFTIHRIVEVSEKGVITKGDANNGPDPLVRYEEIVGKTISFNKKPIRIPLLGNISIFINKNKM